MARHLDRDDLLAAINLAALATELCGPPHGQGRNARWHCPNPNHPDAHPSMTIFRGYRSPRWHCHACGAGGTAIDLYATATGATIGDTIRHLAQQAGLERDGSSVAAPSARNSGAAPIRTPERAPRGPDAAIELYVTAAQQLLWSPQGQGAREYLRRRRLLDPDLLQLNRVGYDPGPRDLARATGLPHRGSGIVLPVLDERDRAIYCVTRYFDPTTAGLRYDNVSSQRAINPKVAFLRNPVDRHPDVVVVTEGIIDGLTVARHGYRAISVLGAASAAVGCAERIIEGETARHIVLALDGDSAGRTATTRLASTLAARGHAATIVGVRRGDLNGASDDTLHIMLSSAAGPAMYPRSPPTSDRHSVEFREVPSAVEATSRSRGREATLEVCDPPGVF